jgi:predicted HicB family RNase H-like nuclease
MADLNSHVLGAKSHHKGNGRPRVHDHTFVLRVPNELHGQVTGRAQIEEMPVAVWIRRAMRAQLRKKVSL